LNVYDPIAKDNQHEKIFIDSHWNRSEWVVIRVNGVSYNVNANDLIAAVVNAQNSAR
jgi:hypothetical protein